MDVCSNATCLTSLRERESHCLFPSFSISAELPNRLRQGAAEEEITIQVAQYFPDVSRRVISTHSHFPYLRAVSP
jgi:hypothetical protein